ncbi:hypothetical protein JCM10212_000019 [Sporobolomyces blumeae]
MTRLLILHASVTGTALDLAHRLALQAHRHGFVPSIASLAAFPPRHLVELTPHDPVVFVLPTTGNGTCPPPFIPLWSALLHPGLPPDFLDDVRYAVFALGDSSYPKYNWVGKKFDNRVKQLGAVEIVPKGEGDDQNEFGVESTFPEWSNRLFDKLAIDYPPRPGFVPLAIDSLPPPSLRINDPSPTSSARPVDGQTQASVTTGSDQRERAKIGTTDWTQGVGERGVVVEVVRNERVTDTNWWQDVRDLELEVDPSHPDFSYTPGDVLELRPSNDPDEVQRFLECLGWDDIADQMREWTPRDQAHLPVPYRATLRSLLTHEFEISSVPKVGVFEWLAGFAASNHVNAATSNGPRSEEDENEIGEKDMADKLKEFATPQGQDDLMDYAIRPRRTLTEILQEFKRVLYRRIPVEYIFDWIPAMRPRGFSIASSPTIHSNRRIQLLVAIVKYKTNLSIERRGVATRWVDGLRIGDRFHVRIDRTGQLRMPPPRLALGSEHEAPLIMVGPGTGVAPFKALVEERVARGIRDNLLFFGCRSMSADAHYHDYFSDLSRGGSLDYVVAASRDQDDKVYVQHRIAEYRDKVSDWMSDEKGGYLYICGSSTAMPRAVKKCVLSIFRETSALDEAGAERRWDELERAGRIREEVWG